MIDYRLVAYYTNGAQIFSYINVNKVYTEGVELSGAYKINNYLSATAGYQLLFTADKNQLEKIKSGSVYTRDENGISKKMTKSEYVGLPNRSRHMANLKLLFEKNNYFVNARAIYRSHWAVSDKDGNGLYNTNDLFAKGFIQVNISGGVKINPNFRLQIGCDNLLNYSDKVNLTALAGRNIYCLLAYQFSSNKNKK
jgi:outer membrane receptor for ferrienterochelin and colicins